MKPSSQVQLKFSNRFLYPSLQSYEGLRGKLPIVNPSIYLGLEVEAEHVSNKYSHNAIPGSFGVTDDGSLKEWGTEYVSAPIRFKYVEIELRRLFGAIPKAVFSPRTSIHVHMNCRDFTNEELMKFLILYLIFERNLYEYSGGRWLNNFCIPLHSNSEMVEKLLIQCQGADISELHWCKYHGLNVLPLLGEQGSSERIGTIEFRHMIGNNNVDYIMNWCNMILCLKLGAKKMPLNVLLHHIKSNACISTTFISTIFGEWGKLFDLNCSRNLSLLKESVLGTKIICNKTALIKASY